MQMSSSQSTLYDRARKTGYLMGPKHKYGPAMDDKAAPPEPAGDGAGKADQKPPNLRDAGAVIDSCSDCVQYQASGTGGGGAGHCGKFNTPVAPNQVCDEFEEKGDQGNEESSDQEIGPHEAR
jgi:hypothetical protein